MNTACPLLLSVISSLVLCSWGSNPTPSTCSALASGVLYGAFSLKDLFPVFSPGCSWTLENPDPTKYTLYLKFTHEEQVCSHLSPMVQPLDHYLPNHTCNHPEEGAEEARALCLSGSPFTFSHFDKNFLRICLSEQPLSIQLLPDSILSFRFVEVLLVNHDNSSQFACGVLCRWFEECLRARDWGVRCGLTQTGCTCPETAARGHNNSVSNSIVPAGHNSDCCVTQLLPGSSNEEYPRPIPYGDDEQEENQKVKTQRPRSADEPAVYMAQTGDPAAEGWSQWGVCSTTCGQGTQVRTRSCVSSPYGTLCSGPLRETRTCNNTATCPAEGIWLDWGPWGRCSVTCSNGTQERTRKCGSISLAGGECRGQQTDTRECTNLECPALHEMCKDEYVSSMTWKKAAAGEIVYNKCPPNATGSASRRCLLSPQGVAYWSPPSFARCVSHDYRFLHLALREHLAKGQRLLAGQGMTQVVRSMLELVSSKNYYSGDLLFCVEILRNVTDTYKRATYVPSFEDIQKFFHAVSHILDADNREKWEDAQQVAPGSVLLMKVLEDYIHLVGDALKPFQSSIIVTENLVISIQREPVSAVSSDINFPMKGRRGMNDWARNSEDKLFIPKEVLSLPQAETEDSAYFVIGAVLYRTLGFILPPPSNSLAVSSKVLTVTVRPLTKPVEQLVVVELSHIINGTSSPQCVVWDYSKSDVSSGTWDSESCQTLPTHPSHTKCLCNQLSTFAVLAQLPKELVMDVSGSPSVPLMIGCAVSCMALLILLAVYAAFWRFIRSERSIILLNFCLSILASNVLILVGQSQALSKAVCALIAAFLHFFFLSSFCWVLTEAWQSYLAVIGQMRTRLVRKRFLCLGWGLPALVVAVSVGFTRTKGYGTPHYCWLSLEGGLLYAFVGPAAVIVLVNMLIGIIVFNKLMSRDGISDKSKKQRAGIEISCRNLALICSTCGVLPSANLSAATASNAVASLWSSCVVLPLLALTWMSAVLAMTDRRSILFQVLFAVFNSVQGCVIITVHCFLRREVQEVVKCQMGGCRSDENEDSPNSCKNGQLQIMSEFEKDVDLACQSDEKGSWYTAHGETVLFKELNTCHPSSVTGALSRISIDDEDDLKMHKGGDGLSFSHLPGNLSSQGGILLQVPKITHNQVNELNEPLPKKEINLERGPLYLCPEGNLWPLDFGDIPQEPSLESEYMVLPRRTLSLKPFNRDHGKFNMKLSELGKGRQQSETDSYPNFLSVDHINVNLTPPYVPAQHQYGLPFKQPPSVRQILASEMNERSRTMPRTVPGASLSAGSLERKRLRYSDLDFEKVMHTRKRHSELYHELNRKFHTLERYRDASAKRDKRWSISSGGAVERTSASEKTSPAGPHQKVWDSYRASSSRIHDRLGLRCVDWDQPPRVSMDMSDGDYQTEV